MVKVTKADRDAAIKHFYTNEQTETIDILMYDFAAHRIAAIEECANKVMQLGKEGCSETLGYARYFADEIRALKGGNDD